MRDSPLKTVTCDLSGEISIAKSASILESVRCTQCDGWHGVRACIGTYPVVAAKTEFDERFELFSPTESQDSPSCSKKPPFIKRQGSGNEQRDCNESNQHTEIRAGLVHSRPESLFEQHWNLGGRNCDHNVDEQRHSRKNSKETDNQKCPGHDFYDTHERTRKLGSGNTDFQKASRAERGGKEKLLNAFRKEDPAHKNANEQDARREAALRILRRHRFGEPQADFAH